MTAMQYTLREELLMEQVPAVPTPPTTTEPPRLSTRTAAAASEHYQRQLDDQVTSALPFDEVGAIVVDDRGGIERKCFDKDDALVFAQERVGRVGGVHVVFKRVAVVRPPKPAVEVVVDDDE